MPRPFISYARADQPAAVRLYADLKSRGATPWLDLAELVPGQEWASEIRSAIHAATHVIVLISKHSSDKRGFVQKEIREALETAGEFPPGHIFVIPARLEDVQPHYEQLHRLHWVDLFPDYDEGLARLSAALNLNRVDTPVGRPRSRRTTDGKRAAALQAAALITERRSFWRHSGVIVNPRLPNADQIAASLQAAGVFVDRLASRRNWGERDPDHVAEFGCDVGMTGVYHVCQVLFERAEAWKVGLTYGSEIRLGSGWIFSPAPLDSKLMTYLRRPTFTMTSLKRYLGFGY